MIPDGMDKKEKSKNMDVAFGQVHAKIRVSA